MTKTKRMARAALVSALTLAVSSSVLPRALPATGLVPVVKADGGCSLYVASSYDFGEKALSNGWSWTCKNETRVRFEWTGNPEESDNGCHGEIWYLYSSPGGAGICDEGSYPPYPTFPAGFWSGSYYCGDSSDPGC